MNTEKSVCESENHVLFCFVLFCQDINKHLWILWIIFFICEYIYEKYHHINMYNHTQ